MKERREPKDGELWGNGATALKNEERGMQTLRTSRAKSILAGRASCAGDGQVHCKKNFCCIEEFYNGLWRSNMVKASRAVQKIEGVGHARSRKTVPRTGSFRPGVMARDSATNKALNARRELTNSINPFDAPSWISRNGPGFALVLG